jgi:hypothetical protein
MVARDKGRRRRKEGEGQGNVEEGAINRMDYDNMGLERKVKEM